VGSEVLVLLVPAAVPALFEPLDQREVGVDTVDFASGLRSVLRQDPDVILIGEMRDLETIHTAITVAETGHLVFASLHTNDTAQALDRIIDVFPPEQQQQIRVQLANTLLGVIYQQLLPRSDRPGRVAAFEVMLASTAARNLVREGKTAQIYSAIQTSGSQGMQTMDAHLAQLVRMNRITVSARHRTARHRTSPPRERPRTLVTH